MVQTSDEYIINLSMKLEIPREVYVNGKIKEVNDKNDIIKLALSNSV